VEVQAHAGRRACLPGPVVDLAALAILVVRKGPLAAHMHLVGPVVRAHPLDLAAPVVRVVRVAPVVRVVRVAPVVRVVRVVPVVRVAPVAQGGLAAPAPRVPEAPRNRRHLKRRHHGSHLRLDAVRLAPASDHGRSRTSCYWKWVLP
jgi:hypothetical protein